MNNSPKRKINWNLILIVVGHLITILIFINSNHQVKDQLRINDLNEFKRKKFERRASAYSDIANMASKIIVSIENKKEARTLISEFEKLYWAQIPFIDDAIVEEKMKLFRKDLNDFLIFDDESVDNLKISQFVLLKQCQKSLKETWDSSLSNEK